MCKNLPPYKIVLYVGLVFYLLGIAYVIIASALWSYKLTPIDLLSTGIGFIGLGIAMKEFKE